MQWDYPGGSKKLFSSPVRNTTDSKSFEDEAATHIISEDRSLQGKESEEVGNSPEQVRLIKPCSISISDQRRILGSE